MGCFCAVKHNSTSEAAAAKHKDVAAALMHNSESVILPLSFFFCLQAAGESAAGDAGDEAEEEDAEGDDMRYVCAHRI